MNRQKDCMFPLPIIEELIRMLDIQTQVAFRATCKLFKKFVDEKIHPIVAIPLNLTKMKSEIRPYYAAINSAGNTLYVSDAKNRGVKKIQLSSKEVETICGICAVSKNEIDSTSNFNWILDVALDEKRKRLYASDVRYGVVRNINLKTGKVSLLSKSQTFAPRGLALDSKSDHLYFSDSETNQIIRISLKTKKIQVICGGVKGYQDGDLKDARFNCPRGIAWNSATHELYVCDAYNCLIRVISMKEKRVSTLCGKLSIRGETDGVFNESTFNFPEGITLDPKRNCLYVTNWNGPIRKISLCGKKEVTSLFPTIWPIEHASYLSTAVGVTVCPKTSNLYLMCKGGVIMIQERRSNCFPVKCA